MQKEFDIDRSKVRIYYIVTVVALFLLCSVFWLPVTISVLLSPIESPLGIIFGMIGGIGLFVSIGYIALTPLMTDSLHLQYRLDDRTLRVDKGIIFKSRKSIPLEKITDLELVQGPLLRVLGMWSLRVQTASTGQQIPEATLVGCINPEQVRDEVLAARDEYLKSR